MRIVGGKHRGRKLRAPLGQGIRPTSDRVRESIFNILTQRGDVLGEKNWVQNAFVLDGFAGTGAMALEAISRGALHATLFDKQQMAFRSCRENVEMLHEERNVDVYFADCLKPRVPDHPCSLIFLDPPYRLGLTVPALEALDREGWISSKAIVVLEIDKTEQIQIPSNFTIINERQYGKAKILFIIN